MDSGTPNRIRIGTIVLGVAATFCATCLAQEPIGDWGPSFSPILEPAAASQFHNLYRPDPLLRVRAEYFPSWLNDPRLPPLLTTSPAGTLPNEAGVLGEPGTTVLYGDESFGGGRSGVRGTMIMSPGFWADELSGIGIEANVMWIGAGQRSEGISTGSQGDPILARPFIDATTGMPGSELIAYPGVTAGTFLTEVSSELQSIGVSLRQNLRRGDWGRIDLLAGYRLFKLRETLEIVDSRVLALVGDQVEATTIDVVDSYRTKNNFHGGEIGIVAEVFYRTWELELLTKVGIGRVGENLNVDGFTIIDPGREEPPVGPPVDIDPQLFSGGVLTSPVDLGRHRSTPFALLPELNVTLQRRITPDLVFTVGYTVMFLSDVIRLGDQVDLVVGGSQPPTLVHTDLWLHGIHVGLEF